MRSNSCPARARCLRRRFASWLNITVIRPACVYTRLSIPTHCARDKVKGARTADTSKSRESLAWCKACMQDSAGCHRFQVAFLEFFKGDFFKQIKFCLNAPINNLLVLVEIFFPPPALLAWFLYVLVTKKPTTHLRYMYAELVLLMTSRPACNEIFYPSSHVAFLWGCTGDAAGGHNANGVSLLFKGMACAINLGISDVPSAVPKVWSCLKDRPKMVAVGHPKGAYSSAVSCSLGRMFNAQTVHERMPHFWQVRGADPAKSPHMEVSTA